MLFYNRSYNLLSCDGKSRSSNQCFLITRPFKRIGLALWICRRHDQYYQPHANTTILEKYPTILFYFFCENLVDFNKTRLHEATLNVHTHAWIFFHLSISSVDGKQTLSEVVFSTLVGFSKLHYYRWQDSHMSPSSLLALHSFVSLGLLHFSLVISFLCLPFAISCPCSFRVPWVHKLKIWCSKRDPTIYLAKFVRLCVCYNANLSALSKFGPLFTADRSESVTHFLCLHHFGGQHYKTMCMCYYVKDKDKCICIGVVLWWNLQRSSSLNRRRELLIGIQSTKYFLKGPVAMLRMVTWIKQHATVQGR